MHAKSLRLVTMALARTRHGDHGRAGARARPKLKRPPGHRDWHSQAREGEEKERERLQDLASESESPGP